MKEKPAKDKIVFECNGTTFSGYLISSMELEPHFHWFLLEDIKLIEIFGDSIAFIEENKKLKPVHTYSKHKSTINALRECIENFLQGK